MTLPSIQPNIWRQRYETLRRHLIENRQTLQADPLGLTLLLRNGMASWIRTWQAGAEPAPKIAAAASQWSRPPTTLWQQELTRLIAHMTGPHLHPRPRL